MCSIALQNRLFRLPAWPPITSGVWIVLFVLAVSPAFAANRRSEEEHHSLTDARASLPDWSQFTRVITMRDYNTRVVAGGTLMLGIAAGVVGVFMLLRRRSLVGDVISHASLPGIGVAFLVLEVFAPGSGKSLPYLLLGALASGLCGIASTAFILRYSRIKEDAALAIVLSVFFGFGIVLLTVIQKLPSGNAAGLQQFIFGKAASMVVADIRWIAVIATIVIVVCGVLFKEFRLLSFDEPFAESQGWPVVALDLALMTLVTVVTVIALQSVGMLLAVAMLVTPAAAARFWTNDIGKMSLLAAALGGAGAITGVFASALFPRLAAGAVIVLSGSTLFLFSMLFGIRRGLTVRIFHQRSQRIHVGRDHLLRAFFEHVEAQHAPSPAPLAALTTTPISLTDLLDVRSWGPRELNRWLRRAEREGLVSAGSGGTYRLTKPGAEAARHLVRNHRLWELYLIEHADIAPSHVDRDADDIEHLIGPEVVAELEELLAGKLSEIPPSPH